MILLTYPSGSSSYVFSVFDFMFDYISTPHQNIELTLDDSMQEARGPFGENSVRHTKYSGSVTYTHITHGAINATTGIEPYKQEWAVIGFPYKVSAYCGLIENMKYACWYSSTRSTKYVQVSWRNADATWTIRRYEILMSLPNRLSGNVYEYLIRSSKPTGSNTIVIDYQRTAWAAGYQTRLDWPSASADFLRAYSPLGTPTIMNSTITRQLYPLDVSGFLSVSGFKSTIQGLVLPGFPPPSRLEHEHYGNLATRAVSTMQANHVNMLALLRDLRNPQELIPKLRNLRNMRTWANGYLTVHYGWLPTISDIQRIVEAFQKRGPYMDSNGFETYNADYRAELAEGDTLHKLEQHLKLAVGKEDEILDQLVRRVDSAGFLPTLKNLWDLIPYSFVIDWLLDVGDFLERVDTRLRLTRIPVRYVTMSNKQTSTTSFSGVTGSIFTGSITRVHYHRWVSGRCPVPPLSLQTTVTDFDHWIEATALLIQRAKS